MKWFLQALRKYATFSGRAQRSEYWFFQLFYFLISLAALMLDALTGTLSEDAGMGIIGLLVTLGLFLPSLAVSVRRLHDTNRSGWWLLLWLVPLVGFIAVLVFMCLDSENRNNRFGPNPKDSTSPTY